MQIDIRRYLLSVVSILIAIVVFAMGVAAPLTPSIGVPSIQALIIFAGIPAFLLLFVIFIFKRWLWAVLPALLLVGELFFLAKFSYSVF